MTLIGNAIKAARQSIKAAPKAKPFYSAVDKAALELARPKGTGKEFMTELKKTKGVKPAEIEHRKLEQIEQLPKMTKEQFLAELEKRPPAQVSEKVLEPRTREMLDEAAEELFPSDYGNTTYRQLDDAERERVRELLATRTASYGEYQIPGGQNYREILLQLPTFKGEGQLMFLDAQKRHGGLTPELEREYEQLKEKKASFNSPYFSRHWEGNPNVLAHMRVSDRVTPEGKNILHVEEIQSDWHQEGRQKGYKTPEVEARRKELEKLAAPFIEANKPIPPELRKEIESLPQLNAVPDAPFKKNWHELALKRLVDYAIEHDYDGIAITPGAEQAKRYDLSKHISEISYGANPDGTYSLSAIDKNGRPVINKANMSQSELENTVGKEMTKKIVEGQGKEYPVGSISEGKKSLTGLDLQVGGEGMKGFYDKMVPDYLNQFGKPYGVQVELGGYKLMGDPSMRGEASERLGLAGERFDQMTPEQIEAFNAKLDEANAKNLHYFPFTEKMREDLTQKGQPLYQQIGIPLGAGTAETQVETPQPTEQAEEPAFAAGGAAYNTNPDMSDGGQILQGDAFKRGGKVHIADNPDTMFMELHDRMFKRK